MTTNRFADGAEWKRLRLRDAEILYCRTMCLPIPGPTILAELICGIAWQAKRIVIFGREYPQPRLIAWYGDQGKRYRYSGLDLNPLPWTDLLSKLKGEVERAVQSTFNGVLLNYYRDGRDSVGMHSDDEPELGDTPTIASMSFGETRTFVLRHKMRPNLRPVRLPLHSTSLLLMKGTTQRYWKHGICKSDRDCGPRVNLTFRRIL